jgi:cell wall-associated NlpC family hydrolase
LRPPFASFAEQYGSVLQRNGYRQVSFPPQPGDVAVFQSGVFGAFQGGHVGIVEGVRQIRSTNQPGKRVHESGCNNVSVWEIRGGMNPRDLGGRVTFWHR